MSIHFQFDVADEVFDMEEGDKLDICPNQDGGIIKHLLKKGEGNFRSNFNDKVSLLYTGYKGEIAPEYIFDCSERDGRSFDFRLGKGKVIRGFEHAVLTMRKGEHAIIYLKPEYAYGRGGAPPKVPPNTIVIFNTQILDVYAEDLSPEKDQSILKHILTRGKGFTTPNDGCMVDIHITGWHGDRQFDDRDLKFPYGEGSANEFKVPKFVEQLLRRFKIGETAELTFKSKHAYGANGFPDFDIPPDADLHYKITMREYERIKDIWEMDNMEKMDQSEQHKEKGTFYFKRGEYELARKFYKRMLENVEFDFCMQGEEEIRRKRILVTAFLNLAVVYLKLQKFNKVRESCDRVLEVELNVKALFRRGQASFHMNLFQEAKEDFEGVLDLEPDNRAAQKQLVICTQQLKKSKGEDKELAKRMMSKIGKGKDDDLLYGSGMNDIGDWDNSMAHGMMTLEQECEAFGEPIPRTGGNNHGIGHED